jgi:hypothetical protein
LYRDSWKLISGTRLIPFKVNAIESKEPGIRAYPQKSVCGLRQSQRVAGISVLFAPRPVRKLMDVAIGVERECTGAPSQYNRKQRSETRLMPHSSPLSERAPCPTSYRITLAAVAEPAASSLSQKRGQRTAGGRIPFGASQADIAFQRQFRFTETMQLVSGANFSTLCAGSGGPTGRSRRAEERSRGPAARRRKPAAAHSLGARTEAYEGQAASRIDRTDSFIQGLVRRPLLAAGASLLRIDNDRLDFSLADIQFFVEANFGVQFPLAKLQRRQTLYDINRRVVLKRNLQKIHRRRLAKFHALRDG